MEKGGASKREAWSSFGGGTTGQRSPPCRSEKSGGGVSLAVVTTASREKVSVRQDWGSGKELSC